jgi:hypothetical protein
MEAVTEPEPAERLNYHPTFSQWIYFQRDAEGLLGRVARWIYDDVHPNGRSCWPHRAKTVSHMTAHMRVCHRHDRNVPTEMQIREVHRAFRKFCSEGSAVPVRRGGLPPRIGNPNIHRGYLLSPATVDKIRDLARLQTITDGRIVSQGKIIERLVDVAYSRRFRKSRAKISVLT